MLTLTDHLQDQHGEKSEAAKPDVTSTPSKKLGLFWDRSSEAAKLEEELMTTKLHETAAVAELKEARLKVGEGAQGQGPREGAGGHGEGAQGQGTREGAGGPR